MKPVFSSKLVAVLLALFVLFAARLKYQQYREDRTIEKAKQELLNEEAQEMQKNKQLSDSLHMLDSEDFKEKIARGQLNMKREGEMVFNFTAPQEQYYGTSAPAAETPNAQKWWNYFFGTPHD